MYFYRRINDGSKSVFEADQHPLKSIWLETTTVLLWFFKKIQIFHGHLRAYLTATQSNFDELDQHLDKHVIWNNLYTFPFKTHNWYFPPH